MIALVATDVFVISAPPVVVLAQDWVTESVCPMRDHLEFHRCALAAGASSDAPRTPDNRPNFSGLWRRIAAAHESLQAHPATIDDDEAPSAVVDPPDGIVPMQDWAEAERRHNRAHYLHHNALCRLDGVPVTMWMMPRLQFVQTSNYLLVEGESAHAFRTIELGGQPHIGRDIRLWNGDSIGHWDGDTLVVETSNQNGRPWLDQRGRFYTDEAQVTERFTLIDTNTIHWQMTLDDPNVYTRPFTVAIAYRRIADPQLELWEEACYENNASAQRTFFNVGYKIYRGITGEEARRLREAWEVDQRELEYPQGRQGILEK